MSTETQIETERAWLLRVIGRMSELDREELEGEFHEREHQLQRRGCICGDRWDLASASEGACPVHARASAVPSREAKLEALLREYGNISDERIERAHWAVAAADRGEYKGKFLERHRMVVDAFPNNPGVATPIERLRLRVAAAVAMEDGDDQERAELDAAEEFEEWGIGPRDDEGIADWADRIRAEIPLVPPASELAPQLPEPRVPVAWGRYEPDVVYVCVNQHSDVMSVCSDRADADSRVGRGGIVAVATWGVTHPRDAKARDESNCAPGWEIVDESRGLYGRVGGLTDRKGTWNDYDDEHGYAPSAVLPAQWSYVPDDDGTPRIMGPRGAAAWLYREGVIVPEPKAIAPEALRYLLDRQERPST